MRPDETGDIFFVAVGDGTGAHYFSKTLEEHNAAVRRFLARQRQQSQASPIELNERRVDSSRWKASKGPASPPSRSSCATWLEARGKRVTLYARARRHAARRAGAPARAGPAG